MRIAYILSSLANSGPIIVAHDLAELMVAHGHDVKVFYFDDKVGLDFPCPTIRIKMTSRLRFDDFDVVHCHGLRPDLFVSLHKPIFACKTRCFTTIHSYMFQDHAFKYGKRWAKITVRIVLAATMRANKVIVLSKNMMDYYKTYLPQRKLTYAYNSRLCDVSVPLSQEEQKEILAFKGDGILLCSVSGLNERKGLHQIIRSLSLLPNCKYCVVGDGAERKRLENLAIELGVGDRVLFVGSKPQGFRYLKYANVFVMPSYSEGFPLAMLEAASMGKAIVCSDIPVFNEIFTNDKVVKFELDNTQSLAFAVERAVTERVSLEHNVIERYNNSYSPERFYQRHISIYEDETK